MSVDFSRLNDGLETILDYGNPQEIDAGLASSYSGQTLYEKGSWLGRSFLVLYSFLSFFSNSAETPLGALKYNFRALSTLFNEAIKELKDIHEKLAKKRLPLQGLEIVPPPLMHEGAPNATEDDPPKVLRGKIIAYTEAMPSLFNLLSPFSLQPKIQKIQLVFEKILGERLVSVNQLKLLHDFEGGYAAVALEGILDEEMPILELRQLAVSENLSSIGKEKLQKWLRNLKNHKERVTPWLIHKALFSVLGEALQDKVYFVELALLKRGCKVLDIRDLGYQKWFETIAPDVSMSTDVVLGRSIQYKIAQDIGLELFEHVGHPNQMIAVGKGITFLYKWEASCAQSAWGVPCVEVIERDPEGRFLVLERLTPLDQNKVLNPVECDEIARLLAWMVSQSRTPKHFLPEFIFLTEEGDLRSLIPFKTDAAHDYNVYENFALKVSHRGYYTFQYIMKRARLIEHPVAKFYAECVRAQVIKVPNKLIGDEASLRKISDPKVIERAHRIVEQFKEFKLQLFRTLVPELTLKNDQAKKQLEEAIKTALLKHYEESLAPVEVLQEGVFLENYLKQNHPTLLINKIKS